MLTLALAALIARRVGLGRLDLSAPGQDAYYPALAVARDGDSVLAWQRSYGVNQRIKARTVTDTACSARS